MISEEQFEEIVFHKGNSFSRNFLEVNKDYILNCNLLSSFDDTFIADALVCHLDLTIHAIDEKQSCLSINRFKDIFGSFVFKIGLQRNLVIISAFGNRNNSSVSANEQFARLTVNSFTFTRHKNVKLIDVGFFSAAMTMNASYGIQDLLMVYWNYLQKNYSNADFENFRGEIILNRDAWNLSTFTFWPEVWTENSLLVKGNTKVIADTTVLEQFRYALKIFDVCRLKRPI